MSSLKDRLMAEETEPLKFYERQALLRRYGQKVAMLENLEKMNLDGARPLFVEMHEDAMVSMRDATEIHSILRLQGEARAYHLLGSTVETLKSEIKDLQKEMADAGLTGEGNAAP